MFQEGMLKAGDKNAIKDFSEKYIVSEKLVADSIDHLTDIELRKGEQRMTESVQQESNRNTIRMTLTGKIFITKTNCQP